LPYIFHLRFDALSVWIANEANNFSATRSNHCMANGRESNFPTNGHGFRRNCSCMHRRGRTHDDGQIHQGSGAAPAHHLTVQAPDTYTRPLDPTGSRPCTGRIAINPAQSPPTSWFANETSSSGLRFHISSTCYQTVECSRATAV
jgi:hypothetical protein